MSDTARTLVEQMVAAGEWPEPELLEAIAAQGEAAVEPLLEVVRRDAHGWPEEAPLSHALGLLGVLKSPAAVPALLELFSRYEHETLEDIPPALTPFASGVMEPLLDIIRQPNLHWYSRAVAGNIAIDATRDNPELRARLTATLRELLAGYVARADSLDANEVSMTSSLIVDLSHLADPQARDLINAAVAAGLSEMMTEDDIEDVYREGGYQAHPKEEDWLQQYRDHYQQHLERERRRAQPPPPLPPLRPPQPKAAPPAARYLPPPLPTIRVERKLGRNDPCWCGSGKKYKICHMRLEQK